MALSIEIRNGYVYLVEAKTTKTSISIRNLLAYEYPEEWVNDAGIVDIKQFSNLLSVHLKDYRFRDKDAYVCINNPSVIYRELNLPEIDERRLPLLVRSEMMSALNLTPDYIMDYVVLNEFESDSSKFLRVLAVAMQKSAIESVLEVLKQCKLRPVVIDSATNAVLKLVKSTTQIKDSNQVILADIGNGHLRLYLFENGEYGLSRNNKLVTYTEDNRDDIVDTVTENINKMIQFSYTRSRDTDLKKIILTGTDSLLEDVRNSVKENLLVECEILESPSFVVGGVKYENKYVNAIGTLVRK
jgi:type IV pilus assembly protein PilM